MLSVRISIPFRLHFYSIIVLLVLILSLLSSVFPTHVTNSQLSETPITPVNPAASESSKNLLAYLYSLSGKMTISGQHDYLESPDEWSHVVKTITDTYSGIHGYELGATLNQSDKLISSQRSAVVDSAIQWYKAGGIVTIAYHASLPGTCACWSNVQKTISQKDFDKIITPGTTQYKQLIEDLDKAAVYLKQLRDTGVPVLWRPYHEMNGNWFWWGKKNNYASLWNIMYERFVGYHKLNNLLWVWSPNAPNASADKYELTYPGSDKVDILAADVYGSTSDVKYYTDLLKLANGKPIAIGENGQLPNPAIFKKDQKKWVYVMTWGKLLTEDNTPATIRSFYNSDVILTRDELNIDPMNGILPNTIPSIESLP
ncbi:glycosyl hydrolase [Paenibacillus psychroresistens]|uniref:Glycosyl hydrolase n=1 Tax=Paenibacillus psychroresistens TaxID=1778678 RepID=A0A6B8RN01_9BACL|nr:glycosyl hydrolase [Paenibacillus psychroresistens]QGQ97217.1 glycosyl hydrolase [Paenibacillus psychroresistens]